MTDRFVSIAEKTNADALALAEQRAQSTQALISRVDERLAAGHFDDADMRKLTTLKSDLSKANATSSAEIKARLALFHRSTRSRCQADHRPCTRPVYPDEQGPVEGNDR